MWERFFNWQTDMDWVWGPFLSLRPSRETPIRPWVWVRLFVVFTLLGLLLVALGVIIVVQLPKLAASQHWALPSGAAETLATLSAMAADPGFQLAVIGLVLSLPGLFFLACLPYHVAWNRRAARLAAMPVPDDLPVQNDVWPPAPKTAE